MKMAIWQENGNVHSALTMLVTRPSKDAEIHGPQWPALNHGIFYDYKT